MAQEVTLMGATYSDVPSILLPDSNSTYHSFVDTSDATATASEILSGYTAYSNGTKVTGTASSGGSSGYTRTVIASEQTVTPTSNGTYYSATLNVSEGFEADAEYIITFNGTEYFFTCQVMWGTNYLLGDINYFYGGSDLPYPFGIIWTSGTTCTIARNNGNQVTVKIEKLELTGSGGGTTPTTPTSISAIDGGEFTLASRTSGSSYSISHSLGVVPKGWVIWTEEGSLSTFANNSIIRGVFILNTTSDSTTSYLYQLTVYNKGFNSYTNNRGSNYSAYNNAEQIKYNVSNNNYVAGITYKWIAWA